MGLLCFKIGAVRRRAGASLTSKVAYFARRRLTDPRTGQTWNYTRRHDLEWTETLLPANAPKNVRNEQQLIAMMEAAEKRVDARTANTLVLSIPRYLPRTEWRDFARAFLTAEFTQKGLPAIYAIHNDQALDGGENPHIHVVISTRTIAEDGLSAKKVDVMRKPAEVYAMRARFADFTNQRLLAEHAKRSDTPGAVAMPEMVDARSLQTRGRQKLAELASAKQSMIADQDPHKTAERAIAAKIIEVECEELDRAPERTHTRRQMGLLKRAKRGLPTRSTPMREVRSLVVEREARRERDSAYRELQSEFIDARKRVIEQLLTRPEPVESVMNAEEISANAAKEKPSLRHMTKHQRSVQEIMIAKRRASAHQKEVTKIKPRHSF